MNIPKLAIRQAVSSVLAKHGIDNLELEMNMADAVYGFFKRFEDGENIELVKADMFDEYIRTHPQAKYRTQLIERIGASLKINITNEDIWESTLKFLEKSEREHKQTIEQFAGWLEDYKFGPPVWKIAQNPDMIKQIWPQAFPEATQIEMQLPKEDGSYDL